MDWLEILGWSQEQIEDIRFAAYAYVKEGLYDVGLTFFHALNALSPDNAYDLQTLGAIYLQNGHNLKALNYLDKALKIDNRHYPTLLNRAKALFSLGYKQQGINQAKELLKSKDRSIARQAAALLHAFGYL